MNPLNIQLKIKNKLVLKISYHLRSSVLPVLLQCMYIDFDTVMPIDLLTTFLFPSDMY